MRTEIFSANVEKLNDVLAFVDEELEKVEAPMKIATQMDIAIEELFVNVASYAYAPNSGDVEIKVEAKDGSIEVIFEDSGVEFDPLAGEDPDITLSAEERRIGGLGIFMVKKFVDEMDYCRTEGKNILRIRKTW